LKKKNVVTFPEYKDIIEGYGIKVETRQELDERSVRAVLDSKNTTAVALDDLTSQVITFKNCDFYIAAKLDTPIMGIAMLFNPNQTVINITKFNQHLVNISISKNFRSRIPAIFNANYAKGSDCSRDFSANPSEQFVK
jgi:hypothetical protein